MKAAVLHAPNQPLTIDDVVLEKPKAAKWGRRLFILPRFRNLVTEIGGMRCAFPPYARCGRGAFASPELFEFVDEAADDAEAVRPEFGVGGV
jgi:hypothetical protein